MAKVLKRPQNYDIIMAASLALIQNSTKMANWCSAIVEFRGEKKSIDIVKRLFDKTIEIADKTHEGQILFGLEGAIDGYMFNLYNLDFSDDDDWINIQFETKWAPIPNDIVRIAETFNLTFTYEFEESGNEIYGKYHFDGEYLTVQRPTDEEIQSCRYKLEEDEDDEDLGGFDFEKMFDIIEHSEHEGEQIKRINEKDLHS